MKKVILIITAITIPTLGLFAQNNAINLQYMDKSVRPQDDFYNYVNGNWMKTTKIPADHSQWGSFNQLRETTDSISLQILKKSLNQKFPKGSEGQKIADIYASFMNMEVRNKQGIAPIKPYLDKVDKINNYNELQNLLVEFTPIGMNPFYEFYVDPSPNDSNKNMVYLDCVKLGLGRDYYQKNDEKSEQILKEYTHYLAQLLKIIGNKTPDITASKLVNFEKQLALSLLTIEQIRDAKLQNNPYSIKDLSKLSKNTDFAKYFTDLEIKVDTVIIPEKKYYENFDKNISSQKISLLKDFIKLEIIRKAAGSLTEELDNVNFNFNGKILHGQKEQRALDKRALTCINSLIGEAFGKLYVAEVFPEEAKVNAKELIDYLKKSFVTHIHNLTWMSASTKEKAIDKLNKFTVKIGYPDQWKDYSKLEIISINDGGSYFQNSLNAKIFKYNKNKDKIGKPVDKSEWFMSPQTVNAYYNPAYNEIVFPAAILQPPFYDYKADAAVNFGGIGAVIGHEMTHGFDDSGSQFDGDGNLKDWWSPEDKIKFEKATQALAVQFNACEPLPGQHINGQLTLGENIADLGGLAISFDALQMYLKDKGSPEKIEGYTPNQRYFMSWVTIWRTKITDQALSNQLKTDPHAPGYYRATVPIKNVDNFYNAFDVKPGDNMYREKDKRVTIW